MAPLTGRACVYYRVIVWDEHSKKGKGDWEDLLLEEKAEDFVLDDGTGWAIVEVAEAKFVAQDEHKKVWGILDQSSERQQLFVKDRPELVAALQSGKKLRYLEALHESGESVSVVGVGTRELEQKESATGYRDTPPMRLRLGGTESEPVAISAASVK